MIYDDVMRWKALGITNFLCDDSISHQQIPVTGGRWIGVLGFALILAWTSYYVKSGRNDAHVTSFAMTPNTVRILSS